MLFQVFRVGGIISYKITLIVLNSIAKVILGWGLSLAINTSITRGLFVLVAPIGVILTALWFDYDIAGSVYRVIISCTILIATYRKMDNSNC